MARTKYGYLHSHFGPDMDGCSRSFTWVENVRPEEDDAYELRAGWFAMCEVEPDAGWVGPFPTEAEAIRVATTEEGFVSFMYGDDSMEEGFVSFMYGDDSMEDLDEEQVYDLYGDEGRNV